MLNIKKILINTFGLKSDEYNKFLLLFFHSFFVGLFIAFYFVQANSVFIQAYDSDYLPYAYITAGLVGYIISSLYSYFQERIKSRNLFVSALAFMLFITLLTRISLSFVKPEYLSFFAFIWAWPFISLVGIESGGLALKLLNLVQVKRLFGMINMGGVIASILGYLIIPLISGFIGSTYNLLLIAAGSLIMAIIILLKIHKNFSEQTEKEKVAKEKVDTGFKSLIKDKYFRLIFISATISMTVIYISDFGFLSAIKVQEGNLFTKPGAVASFMALVFAGLKVGELIISYFSSRILVNYGVKLGLIVLPLSLTLVIFISLIFGFTIGATSVMFLVLMTLNKSLERIMRRGLDDPSFNILYQPLPGSLQMAVQSKVGVVMQFAIAIAGALLLGLNLVLNLGEGFSLEFFPLFFFPILIIWLFVARKLYLAYKSKLREILKDLTSQKPKEASKYKYGTEVLSKKFKKFNDDVVRLSVTILAETNPGIFEPYAASLLKKNDELINKAVLKSIDVTWRDRIVKQINKQFKDTEDNEIKALAEKAVALLSFEDISNLEKADIEKLVQSGIEEDELKLVKYLEKNQRAENVEALLLKLLNSKSKYVVSSAIRISSSIKSDALIIKMLEFLESTEYYHITTAALLDVGEKTLPYLDKMYAKTENEAIKLKIIEIYAKMGSGTAKSLIVNKINDPSRKIQIAVIWALFYCRYQAQESEEKIIKDKILNVIDNLVKIAVSITDIKEEKNTLKLFLALDQERETNYELLFNLLSFLHEPRIITLIKKNIKGKNTIYALELIDNFIEPELKPYIVPLFDEVSMVQRIKKLSKFFPQEKMSFGQRLKWLITLDYDVISSWALAKTLEMTERLHRHASENVSLKEEHTYEDIAPWTKENLNKVLHHIRRSELPDEVFLCLFHPDELIYSTAAKIIYNENPQKCFEYLNKMSEKKQSLVQTLSESGTLIEDKVKLLRRYQLFFSIPDYLLVDLARIIEVHSLKKDEKIYFEADDTERILILIRGELIEDGGKERKFSKKIIITPGMNIDGSIKYLKATKTTKVLSAGRYEYFNLLVDNTGILQHIFDIIQN